MADLRVADDLWATSMLPEGLFDRWRVGDGQTVQAGQVVAQVTIEDATHDIIAPSSGRLVQKMVPGTVIEPGALLATLDDRDAAQSQPAV